MYDLVILYSGGTDSRLLHKMALEQGRKPLLINVRYGQDYTHHDHKLPTECRMVGISGLLLNFDKTYGDDIAQDYIPNRNMMLCAVAGIVAEQEEISEIWLGANHSDVLNLYPDCHPTWISYLNMAMPKNVYVSIPLEELTQKEVIAKLDGDVSNL